MRAHPDRGYWLIGVEHPKTEVNIGTLWRTAHVFGADGIFTIGRRYKRQSSDTTKAWKHLPLFHYDTFDDFRAHQPYDSILIGIEIDIRADRLDGFQHPERAIYLLGAEDNGLSGIARTTCCRIIQLPGAYCLNVATAGAIVMYHRYVQVAL